MWLAADAGTAFPMSFLTPHAKRDCVFRPMSAGYSGAAGRPGALGTEDKGSTGGRRDRVAAVNRNRWPA